MKPTVIDAEDHVLGRLASHVAKRLLQGETITVINAERVLVSGSRRPVVESYRAMRAKGSRARGPYFPRRPDRILRRTVAGMLPRKHGRGREALGRLRVYLGAPAGVEGVKAQRIPDAAPSRTSAVPLGRIAEELGWRPVAAAPEAGGRRR